MQTYMPARLPTWLEDCESTYRHMEKKDIVHRLLPGCPKWLCTCFQLSRLDLCTTNYTEENSTAMAMTTNKRVHILQPLGCQRPRDEEYF